MAEKLDAQEKCRSHIKETLRVITSCNVQTEKVCLKIPLSTFSSLYFFYYEVFIYIPDEQR